MKIPVKAAAGWGAFMIFYVIVFLPELISVPSNVLLDPANSWGDITHLWSQFPFWKKAAAAVLVLLSAVLELYFSTWFIVKLLRSSIELFRRNKKMYN